MYQVSYMTVPLGGINFLVLLLGTWYIVLRTPA